MDIAVGSTDGRALKRPPPPPPPLLFRLGTDAAAFEPRHSNIFKKVLLSPFKSFLSRHVRKRGGKKGLKKDGGGEGEREF